MERSARTTWVQTVPIRLTVDIHRIEPRRFNLADDPLVRIRGVVDLSPDPTEKALPIWFEAMVQLFADRTAEIQSFLPAYGSIQGPDTDKLLGIYEHAFARSLVDTRLRILGVI